MTALRTHILRLLCAGMIVIPVARRTLVAQSQTQSIMLGTKHNLSVSGTGAMRSAGERQLCVFCHTPHVPRTQESAQLWNHERSTEEYTLYSSEYLSSLNYSAPNQPRARSKLCLSCHDGTVALGAVYNSGGSARVIAMQNGVTTMPSGAGGNLGTSLANDHPVGYVYDPARDSELEARPWPWNTPVTLDPDASTGTVECQTCHEPHDDRFGKFLRIDNSNAALCTFCHAKTGWNVSVHRTSTQQVTLPGGTTTTVGERSCRTCHTSHGGRGTPYLLPQTEEATCYTPGCHGDFQPGANTKNIETAGNKAYHHDINRLTGRHKNPDDRASLTTPNRHAECMDCHNSHQARTGLHVPGTNVPSNVLAGVPGMVPGPAPRWTQPLSFTTVTPAQQENQICYKCHSSYAFGTVPGGVTGIVGPSGDNITDQAMEFNPANGSAHPVQVPLAQQIGSPVPRPLTAPQMKSPWTATGAQTMYCTDCHGNDQPVSATIPQGPHGADSRFMLTGRGKYWPAMASGELWSLEDVSARTGWENELFCANCHVLYNGRFQNEVHDKGRHRRSEIKCITCHVAVPHGSRRSRLIGYSSDMRPWNYMGTGPYDRLVITGFRKSTAPATYTKRDCSMAGVCHGTQPGPFEP